MRSRPTRRPRRRPRAPARPGPITDSSADLHGTINLSGDAGGFHFVWGLSQDDLAQLNPGPRRRHRRERHLRDTDALGPESRDARTSTRSSPTTRPAPRRTPLRTSRASRRRPTRRRCSTSIEDSVTDTTANLSIHDQPERRRHQLRHPVRRRRSGRAIRRTDPIDIGADAGDQQLTATLQNLDPNSDYHFEVIATNSVDSTTQSGQDFATDTADRRHRTAPDRARRQRHVELRLPGDRTHRLGRQQRGATRGARLSVPRRRRGPSPVRADRRPHVRSARPLRHPDHLSGHRADQHISSRRSPRTTSDAPSNNTLPAISGTTTPGHTLTTTDGDWNGDPAFDYQWQDCDQNGESCTDTGDDQNTYALTGSDVGHTIRVIVTGSNDGGSTPATSGPTAVVAGPPPSNNTLAGDLGNPELRATRSHAPTAPGATIRAALRSRGTETAARSRARPLRLTRCRPPTRATR